MRVEWLPEAERSRDGQLDHVAARNPRAALDLGDRIRAAVGRLADHPRSGRPGRMRDSQEQIVTDSPYVVVYRVEAEAVLILRVLHRAQRWPPASPPT